MRILFIVLILMLYKSVWGFYEGEVSVVFPREEVNMENGEREISEPKIEIPRTLDYWSPPNFSIGKWKCEFTRNDFIGTKLDNYLHKNPTTTEQLQRKILQAEKERKELSGIRKLARERAKKASLHNKKHEDRPILIHQSDGSEACPASHFLAQRCNDAASLTSLFVLFSSGVVSLKSMSNILKVCGEGNACETKSDEEAREFFSNPEAVSVIVKEIMDCRFVQYTIVPRIIIAAQNRCPMLHESHPIWRDVFDFLGKKRAWIRHPVFAKDRELRINKQAASDESNFRALVSRRIRVSWNKDRSYFDGTITEFDTANRKWTVKYDDGDVRSVRSSYHSLLQ